MTVSAKNSRGEYIRTSQIWAWLFAIVFVPAVTAMGTVWIQGAVYGEKIATIERLQAKAETREERIDERLRVIENHLSRILQKLEGIK
jgi:hypothetical protein